MVGTIGLSPNMDANRAENRPVKMSAPSMRIIEATPPGSPPQDRVATNSKSNQAKHALSSLFIPPDSGENERSDGDDVGDQSPCVQDENHSPTKCSRSFSVVPVDNISNSPKSNLEHVKKRFRSFSALYSENDPDESENLIPEESSPPQSKVATPVDCKPSYYDKNTVGSLFQSEVPEITEYPLPLDCLSSETESSSGPKTSRTCSSPVTSTRARKRPALSIPDESDIPLLTPLLTVPPRCEVAAPPSNILHSNQLQTEFANSSKLAIFDKNLSPVAKRYPKMVLQPQTSVPLHYLTVNAAMVGNSVPRISQHYMTVQPIKSRGPYLQGGPASLNRNFISVSPDGISSVEYGSTDGRNITFSGRRAVLSCEDISGQDKSEIPLHQRTLGYVGEKLISGADLPTIVVSSSKMGDYIESKDDIDGGCKTNSEGDDEDIDGRGTWGSKLKFVLACIGSCVGLGNFWRFPYLCYKSGGGAFLIPYTIMLFLCGIPLLLMEMAIGQYTRRGPVGALSELCPIFVGSAVGVVIISIIFCSYYNIIISWSIYYLTQSFHSSLPWAGRNTHLTAQNCSTNSSTQLYFDTVVLQKTNSIDEYGDFVWPLFACVLIAWIIVYFSIWKSIRSSGNVVLVTATLPYAFIVIFLIRAVTLDGAGMGLQFLFQPNWSKLLDVDVWVYAASQNFNSIGIGFGSMITFSSYNKFSNNLLTDVWVIAIVNACTSLLAGIIVFSTMGNIAHELGCSITEVITQGPGLAFVAYPQALAKMPYPHVFAIMFFLLLIILGIDSQFATVEVIVTSLQDAFPAFIKKRLRYHEVLALLVCLGCFLLGLPNLFEGGIYYFHLVDYYSSAISLMYLAFFEVVAVVWCYGADRLSRNLREMTGKPPSLYFKYCWRFLAPALILAIAVMSWVDHKDLTYATGSDDGAKALPYPTWALVLGWAIACISIIPIPIFAVYVVYKSQGDTFLQKVQNACKPTEEECLTCNRSKRNPDHPCHCHRGKPVTLPVESTLPVPVSAPRPSVVNAFDQQPPSA